MRKIDFNIFVIIRIFIGCLFIISGFEKLIGPYQNFLYVVQSYEFLSPPLEEVAARLVPWGELFLGVFLVLGLWLKWVLRGFLLFIIMFLAVVGQAFIRNLPITECGCFGELFSFPLYVIFIFDSILLLVTVVLLKKVELVSAFSLDDYFAGEQQ